jgi:hypothetical protein
MVNNKSLEKETKKDTKDNATLSRELNEYLTKSFQKVLTDPSLDSIRRYKELETIALAAWAERTFENISEGIEEAFLEGKILATEQLVKKGREMVFDNKENIQRVIQVKTDEAREQINKIAAGIRANSRRLITEVTEAGLLDKKKISKSTLTNFADYGIALFIDSRGARWSIDRYMEMLTTTSILSSQRQAFFETSVSFGEDLVRVIHLGITPECDYCKPFTGKVLSITGKTKGYMTVHEASHTGHLFGPNCDHIAEKMELAPDLEKDDNIIHLNDKILKYMAKKGFDIDKVKEQPYYAAA